MLCKEFFIVRNGEGVDLEISIGRAASPYGNMPSHQTHRCLAIAQSHYITTVVEVKMYLAYTS